MNIDERRILQTTCYGHFMSHFNMLVFPAVVIPLTQKWQVPMAVVLNTSFWMYLLFGLTALPWGLAADRWGAKPLLMVFYGGAGFAGLASAFFIDSPPFFALSMAGIGFFSGIYHPAGLGLISKATRRVSYAMGINGMLGQYSGGRIAERFDPRFGYLIFHSLTIPLAVLLATVGNAGLIMLTVVYFFFLLGMQPMENTLVAQYTPKRLHHSAYGTKFVMTFGVGALSVKMVAWIDRTMGVDAVFPTMGAISLILVGANLVLIRKTSVLSTGQAQVAQAVKN